MTRWQATVQWSGADPVAVELAVETDSLEVLRGEGGVKGLSGPEKAGAVERVEIVGRRPLSGDPLHRRAIDKNRRGIPAHRKLHIRGKSREHVIDSAHRGSRRPWRNVRRIQVRQTDYGIKPYSLLMGSVQVADDVIVVFHRGSRQGQSSFRALGSSWQIKAGGGRGIAGVAGVDVLEHPGQGALHRRVCPSCSPTGGARLRGRCRRPRQAGTAAGARPRRLLGRCACFAGACSASGAS